jgi:hypothetical protein
MIDGPFLFATMNQRREDRKDKSKKKTTKHASMQNKAVKDSSSPRKFSEPGTLELAKSRSTNTKRRTKPIMNIESMYLE